MAYMLVVVLVFGLLLGFFLIVFLPGLMRTTGEHIGSTVERVDLEPQPAAPLESPWSARVHAGQGHHADHDLNFGNTP